MGFTPPPANPKNQNIVEVKNLLHFLQVTQDNERVVVDFYAVWCGPCKAVEPLFDELEAKYRGKGKSYNMSNDSCICTSECGQ